MARRLGIDPADLLAAPYIWLGTAAEIAARLEDHRQRWGITRYVVRTTAVDATSAVLEAVASA